MCQFSKKNHLARCLVYGVAEGRDISRKLRPAMLALAASSRPGVPEAALGHGRSWQPIGVEQEVPVSSREAVLPMCFSIGFRKIATPYWWHVQQSWLFLLFCHFSKKNHLARCLISGVAEGRDNSRKLRPAVLVLAGSSRPGVPEAALGHGRSW